MTCAPFQNVLFCEKKTKTSISMCRTTFFSSYLKSFHGFSVATTAICSVTAGPVLNEPIDTGASGQTEVEEKL